MTFRDIAELCGVGETTVRRWANVASRKMADLHAKMADAQKSKRAARFSLPEALAIIRAGGKATLADLLEANARETAAPRPELERPLSGALLRELRYAVAAGILAPADPRRLLGLAGAPAAPARLLIEDDRAADALAEAAFAAAGQGVVLTPDVLRRAQDAGVGAFAGVLKRAISQTAADSIQGKLL